MATAAFISGGVWIAPGVHRIQWTVTATGFSNSLVAPGLPEKVVHVRGFATVSTVSSRVVIEGSNDPPSGRPDDATPPTYITLTTPTDGDLLVTGDLVKVIRENPVHIRCRASTVTTGANLTVMIVSKA